MPVLESTDNVSPRSALRYRPLNGANKRSVVTTAAHPVVQRASRPRPKAADDDLISEWQRGDAEEMEIASQPESQPQRSTNPPVRRMRFPSKDLRGSASVQAPAEPRATRFRLYPLLIIGMGMTGMIILWVLVTAGLNWWNGTMDYLHYGYPRTVQVDAVVGHNDSSTNPSHFLATNLHGHIEIIEFPGSDGTHTRIFLGPQLYGTDADKAVVTLKFADISGNHTPDMLVFFQSSWIVFINDQGTFRPATDQEHQEVVRYLAAHNP
jgi:hypothetical protein